MGVFDFILLIVLISTIGKVLTARGDKAARAPLSPASDVQRLDDAVSEMSTRLSRLEEERDFYRALLDPPDRSRLGVPDGRREDLGP